LISAASALTGGGRSIQEKTVRYEIQYSPDAVEHLSALSARRQRIIIEAVDEQLGFQPIQRTRHRKPMRPNPLAPWELRIGDLRVYYDISNPPAKTVWIRAIGIKDRDKIIIGDKVVEL
jgi:mRNA-degrading endonuclease RelE of RelBE toxin-antitoxin system